MNKRQGPGVAGDMDDTDDPRVCDFCQARAFRWGVHVCATVTTGECSACGRVEYDFAEDYEPLNTPPVAAVGRP